MRNFMKKSALVFVSLLAGVSMTACGSNNQSKQAKAASAPAATDVHEAQDTWVANAIVDPQFKLTQEYQKYVSNPNYTPMLQNIPHLIGMTSSEQSALLAQNQSVLNINNIDYMFTADTLILQPQGLLSSNIKSNFALPPGNLKLRLLDIDCPAHDQYGDKEAQAQLKTLIDFAKLPVPTPRIEFYFNNADSSGRLLGYLTVLYSNGLRINLNRSLVASGQCFNHVEGNQDPMMSFIQNMAKASQTGIWAQEQTLRKQNKWVMPADYRKVHPDPTNIDIPAGIISNQPMVGLASATAGTVMPTASMPIATTTTNNKTVTVTTNPTTGSTNQVVTTTNSTVVKQPAAPTVK